MVSINCKEPENNFETCLNCDECGKYIEPETCLNCDECIEDLESYNGCEHCLETYFDVSSFKDLLEQNLLFFKEDLCETPYRVALTSSENEIIPELVELNKNGFYTNRLVKNEKIYTQDSIEEKKEFISCIFEAKYLEKLVTYLEMTPELRFIIGKYNQTNITNIQKFPFSVKMVTFPNGDIESPMNIWGDLPLEETLSHNRFFPKILELFKNCCVLNLTTVEFHSNLNLTKILIDFKKFY